LNANNSSDGILPFHCVKVWRQPSLILPGGLVVLCLSRNSSAGNYFNQNCAEIVGCFKKDELVALKTGLKSVSNYDSQENAGSSNVISVRKK